jgi:hypothetical protein
MIVLLDLNIDIFEELGVFVHLVAGLGGKERRKKMVGDLRRPGTEPKGFFFFLEQFGRFLVGQTRIGIRAGARVNTSDFQTSKYNILFKIDE